MRNLIISMCLCFIFVSCAPAPEKNPPELKAGLAALKAGDAEKAFELLMNASREIPNNPAAHLAAADAAIAMGNNEQAQAAYERALLLNPKDSNTYLKLGALCEKCNQFLQARNAYQSAFNVARTRNQRIAAKNALKILLKRILLPEQD